MRVNANDNVITGVVCTLFVNNNNKKSQEHINKTKNKFSYYHNRVTGREKIKNGTQEKT